MVSRIGRGVLAGLLAAAPCAAQELHGGIKGGGSFSSLSNVFIVTGNDNDSSGVYSGPAVGAFATLDVSEYIAIQPEVFYIVKGAALDDDAGGARWVSLKYLELPLLAKLSAPAGGKIGLYALAGGTFALKLDATLREDGGNEDLGEDVSRTDFGMLFGLGMQGGRWLLEGRFSQGLWNVGDNDSHPVRTRGLAVLAGVRF